MSKRIKIALAALVVIALSVTAILATTFALFSDSVDTNNHIDAGTLKIDLYQTEMSGNRLEADGTFGEYPGLAEPINLREYDGKVFEMEKICPGIYRTADFEVRNAQSTTAFTYSVTVYGVEAEGETSQALTSQMQITVTNGSAQTTFMLSEAATSGKTVELGTMLTTDTVKEFSVKAEFVNSDSNNDAKGGSVSFDIKVTATQLVTD